MRNVMKFSQLLLATCFVFPSAGKKNIGENKVEEKLNTELAGKLTGWLEKQQLLYTDTRGQKIDSLKKALVISGLTVEHYNLVIRDMQTGIKILGIVLSLPIKRKELQLFQAC
jgi:hypothetical protein